MEENTAIAINTHLQNELKRFMKLHRLKSLKEVKKIPVPELLKMEGFGYRLLIDVVLNEQVS